MKAEASIGRNTEARSAGRSFTISLPGLGRINMIAVFGGFVVLLFYSYAYLYFYNQGMTSIAPVHWYIFVLGAFGVSLLIWARLLHYVAQAFIPLAWVGVAGFISTISFVVLGYQNPGSLQFIISMIELLLLLAVFIVIFRDRDALVLAQQAMIVVVLVAVALNFVDFFTSGRTFGTVDGRAAGLYENANIAGKFLVFGMILTILRVPPRWRLPYCLIIMTGVLVTFSRSSQLMWALAMVGAVWFNWFRIGRTFGVAALSLALVLAVIALSSGALLGLFDALDLSEHMSQNARQRIARSFLDQTDFSKQERMYVAQRALHRWMDAPIFGHGIGSNALQSTRSHNQFLEMASELGVFGPLLLIGLMWMLWHSGSEVALVLLPVYFVSCFFTHNNLDQPGVQIIVAMALSTAHNDTGS